MYGLYDFHPQIVQITLPAPVEIGLPFAFPTAVYLIRGATYALVDTGFRAARASLLAALAELGVRPAQISKVVLTRNSPQTTGNVELFDRAIVVGHPGGNAPDLDGIVDAVAAEAHALLEHPHRPPSWTPDAIAAFVTTFRDQRPTSLDLLEADDGMKLALGDRTATAMHTPGVDTTAMVYDVEGKWLFGGPTVVIEPEPEVMSPRDFADSIGRITKITPDLILPGYGGVIRDYHWHYRSVSLYTNNLLSNFQFVLKRPMSAAELILRDLGRLPRDLMRVAATVWRARIIISDLVDAGILTVKGDGPHRRYVLGEQGVEPSPIDRHANSPYD